MVIRTTKRKRTQYQQALPLYQQIGRNSADELHCLFRRRVFEVIGLRSEADAVSTGFTAVQQIGDKLGGRIALKV
ncbi:MAG: hypothetical protein R3E08_04690 [Thiotrichaceae bacterium]